MPATASLQGVVDSVEYTYPDGSIVREEIRRQGRGYLFVDVVLRGPKAGEEFLSGFLYSPDSAFMEWHNRHGRIVGLNEEGPR